MKSSTASTTSSTSTNKNPSGLHRKLTWTDKGFSEDSENDDDDDDGFIVKPTTATRQRSIDSLVSRKSKAAKFHEESKPQVKINPEWELDNDKNKKIVLSQEQYKVITAAERGESIFFTGAAGTGKSVVLRSIIDLMKSRYDPAQVAVCATTGMAALNIGGGTLHKWAGIGLGKDDLPVLIRKIKAQQSTKANWVRTRVLIVDEISMLDGTLFDKLNELGKNFGYMKDKPFGGIQVILTGDFYQLPPISENSNNKEAAPATYCFKSKAWNEVIKQQFNLTTVFRQKGDQLLISMLNALRVGHCNQYAERFRSLSRPIDWKDNDIEPSRLYPLKRQVAKANADKLNKLQGRELIFTATDYSKDFPNNPDKTKSYLDGVCPEVYQLSLKRHTLVMHTKNDSEKGLVNGTKGKVIAFATFDVYRQLNELLIKYKWEKAIEVYGEMFETKEFPTPTAIQDRVPTNCKGKFNKLCAEIRKLFNSGKSLTDIVWPIIQFEDSPYPMLIENITREVTNARSDPIATRTQLPLIHAWAISIHKSQGQTLKGVVVDLGSSFEIGQVYVALSRAVSTDSLQVLNFKPQLVKVSDEVSKFYANFNN